jgi:hypothetical protein
MCVQNQNGMENVREGSEQKFFFACFYGGLECMAGHFYAYVE